MNNTYTEKKLRKLSVSSEHERKNLPHFLQSSYIPSLDGFRAISIVLVIFCHFLMRLPETPITPYISGGFGVHIFFVISGFLITSLLIKEKIKTEKISLKRFYIRRFLRIIPVAYLFILTLLLLDHIFSLHLKAIQYTRSLLFVENFSMQSSLWPTKHYWSLSTEEQFYLLFPTLLSRSLKLYVKTAVSLIIVTPVIVYLYYHVHFSNQVANQSIEFIYKLLGSGTSTILLGSLTAIFVINYHDKIRFNMPGIAIFQVLLFSTGLYVSLHKMPFRLNELISDLLIAVLIVSSIMQKKGFVFKLLNLRLVRYIGVLSYSLYIWQQIFTYDQPWQHRFVYGDSLLLNLVLLIIVSMASYHLYEKFFLRLKSRFS